MAIPLLTVLGTALKQYSTAVTPTKSSDMMDYMDNNSQVLAAIANKLLYQPGKAYGVGAILVSDSMADGLVAVVTIAGTTAAEPDWPTTAGQTVVDGSVTFIMSDLLTGLKFATQEEVTAGEANNKAVSPATLKFELDKKQPTEEGKGLSTNDYDATAKEIVDSVPNMAANLFSIVDGELCVSYYEEEES